MRRFRTAAALVVVGVLGLTACGGSDENSIEQAIEEATGGSADVEIGEDGDMEIVTEDGSYSSGDSAEVPDDFPSEVPLPDDLPLVGVFTDGSGWYLTYSAESPDREYCEGLLAEYESDFTEEGRFEASGDFTGIYSSDRYSITVGCTPSAQIVAVTVQDKAAE